MKISSYYYQARPDEHFQLWDYGMGRGIPSTIASLFHMEDEYQILHNDQYDVGRFSDIAYCQLFAIPQKRPGAFIYTFISDYINNETALHNWIQKVRPNLVGCLQHIPQELIDYAKQFNCEVKLLPWYVTTKPQYETKTVTAMCSGCTDPNVYPTRNAINSYLQKLHRPGIITSCSNNFGKYPLSNSQYSETIKKTKYYLSGGIYDRFVPPKYYEVANHGACIVTFDMEMLSQVGFVHNKTCIIIKDLKEIPSIIDSDRYVEIGKNAQKMVQECHSIESRAKEIIDVFNRTSK